MRQLVDDLDAAKKTGRPGYPTRALVGMCLIRHLYGLPTWSATAALVGEHDRLQAVLGACPSVYACYRFAGRLRRHRAELDACLTALVKAAGAGTNLAIDASDVPAWANGQRYVRKNGPERERYSDPDASWGHRSAVSTRGHGGYYGYKLHLAVCTETELPVAWEVRTAAANEAPLAAVLLDQAAARGVRAETVAADKGYDHGTVHEACAVRGVLPVIPLRKARTASVARERPVISRDSEEFTKLYRRRSAVERAFSRLKQHRALTQLRARGLERVRLHVDLTILASLACAVPSERAR